MDGTDDTRLREAGGLPTLGGLAKSIVNSTDGQNTTALPSLIDFDGLTYSKRPSVTGQI